MEQEVVEIPRGGVEVWALPLGKSIQEYTPVDLIHPRTKTVSKFLLSNDLELFMVSKLSRDAFTTLFLEDETHQTARVIGDPPEIHIASKFNVVWFLLGVFLPQMDQESNRMSSYDDLVDIICDKDSNLAQIVQEMNVPISEELEKLCDVVNEGGEMFYRPTKAKMIGFVNERISELAEHLPKAVIEALSTEIDSKIPELLALAAREQASQLVGAFAAEQWVDWANSAVDFGPLRAQMSLTAKTELIETQKRPVNEPSHAKTKAAKKQKPSAVKVGALDRFFSRKV